MLYKRYLFLFAVKLACDSSPEASIISLEYEGKLLTTPADYQREIYRLDQIRCQAKATHIVWEFSYDGINYVELFERSVTPNWFYRSKFSGKQSFIPERNAAGIVDTETLIMKHRRWYNDSPYFYLRCKAMGFPPFRSNAFSKPIAFRPRKFIYDLGSN